MYDHKAIERLRQEVRQSSASTSSNLDDLPTTRLGSDVTGAEVGKAQLDCQTGPLTESASRPVPSRCRCGNERGRRGVDRPRPRGPRRVTQVRAVPERSIAQNKYEIGAHSAPF